MKKKLIIIICLFMVMCASVLIIYVKTGKSFKDLTHKWSTTTNLRIIEVKP
jgi:hypothetical protein